MQHSCVELEHTHGAEDDPDLVYANGNDEPHRGFGHLAFLTPDVYKASEELEKCGVSFKKKPGNAGCVFRISHRSPREPKLCCAVLCIELQTPTLRSPELSVRLKPSLFFDKSILFWYCAIAPLQKVPCVSLFHNQSVVRAALHLIRLRTSLCLSCSCFLADEGRMKGLAFAYDPSGYWVELVKRNKDAGHPEAFNLGQTMLRIKDVDKSLDFYTGQGGMGMTKASNISL